MASTILKILMTVFCLQALVRFYVFFFASYAKKPKKLDISYGNKTSATGGFNNIILAAVLLLFALLPLSRSTHYLSFITAVYIGATVIQIYFHRFHDSLPEDKAPNATLSPIKLMSYAMQAIPKNHGKNFFSSL